MYCIEKKQKLLKNAIKTRNCQQILIIESSYFDSYANETY